MTGPEHTTLTDLGVQLRHWAAMGVPVPDGATSTTPAYRDGYHAGMRMAVRLLDEEQALTADGWEQPLLRLEAVLTEQHRRVRATTTDSPEADARRAGTCAALAEARRRTSRTLAALARQHGDPFNGLRDPDGVDLADWSAYPKGGLTPDWVMADISDLVLFLGGDRSSFTEMLVHLIIKADPHNLNRLAVAYPREVRALIMWRTCAPLTADTLVRLLEATANLGKMNT